mmetsp:Transcript_1410/g.2124  ORF Transcript_1410/g.2124 Transcript_1410/m.2124 type:complete len:904 (-) Transcript_1410:59-2770(-)
MVKPAQIILSSDEEEEEDEELTEKERVAEQKKRRKERAENLKQKKTIEERIKRDNTILDSLSKTIKRKENQMKKTNTQYEKIKTHYEKEKEKLEKEKEKKKELQREYVEAKHERAINESPEEVQKELYSILENEISERTLAYTKEKAAIQLIKETLPFLKSQITKFTNTVEQTKAFIENQDQALTNLMNEEHSYAYKINDNIKELAEAKYTFGKIKVRHSQLALISRLNKSSLQDYQRKYAELEMHRDQFTVDIERLQETIDHDEEELANKEGAFADLEMALIEDARQIRQMEAEQARLLVESNIASAALNETKTYIRKYTAASHSLTDKLVDAKKKEIERMKETLKKVEVQKGKNEKERESLAQTIAEANERLEEGLEDYAQETLNLEEKTNELHEVDVLLDKLRKTNERNAIKKKKRKQMHDEAERLYQVAERKLNQASKHSEKQQKALDKETQDLEQWKTKIEEAETNQEDIKKILPLKAKLGTTQYRVDQAQKALEKAEEAERIQRIHHRSKSFAFENAQRHTNNIKEKADESSAALKEATQKKMELKKMLMDIKKQVQTKKTLVDELKVRAGGVINQSKLEKQQDAFDSLCASAIALQLRIAFEEANLQALLSSVDQYQATIESLEGVRAEQKEQTKTLAESITTKNRALAESRSAYIEKEKKDLVKARDERDTLQKSLHLSRNRMEGYVRQREQYAALVDYVVPAEGEDEQTHHDRVKEAMMEAENDKADQEAAILKKKQQKQTLAADLAQVVKKRKALSWGQFLKEEKQLCLVNAELASNEKAIELKSAHLNHEAIELLQERMNEAKKQAVEHADILKKTIIPKQTSLNTRIQASQNTIGRCQFTLETLANDMKSVRSQVLLLDQELIHDRSEHTYLAFLLHENKNLCQRIQARLC